jgi:hypothetical protein
MLKIIADKLRAHLPNRALFFIAFPLMIILEALTYGSLVWYFFLRNMLIIPPYGLVIAGGIFAFLALVFLAVNMGGNKLCFKILGFQYLAVAIFFPLKGLLLMDNRDFNPWGFYMLWIIIFVLAFRETAHEINIGDGPG